MCHDVDVGVPPAEFGVNNNEADRPICDCTENDEKENPREETSLTDGIWKA